MGLFVEGKGLGTIYRGKGGMGEPEDFDCVTKKFT